MRLFFVQLANIYLEQGQLDKVGLTHNQNMSQSNTLMYSKFPGLKDIPTSF